MKELKKVKNHRIIYKVLFIAIIIILLLIYIVNFVTFKIPIKSEYYNYEPLINEDVKIYLKDNSLNRTGMTIIIENNISDGVIRYGNAILEPKVFGIWGKLSSSKNVISAGGMSSILPGEKKELDIDWSERYGRIPHGKYRYIIQSYIMSYESLFAPNSYEEVDTEKYISYEFEI